MVIRETKRRVGQVFYRARVNKKLGPHRHSLEIAEEDESVMEDAFRLGGDRGLDAIIDYLKEQQTELSRSPFFSSIPLPPNIRQCKRYGKFFFRIQVNSKVIDGLKRSTPEDAVADLDKVRAAIDTADRGQEYEAARLAYELIKVQDVIDKHNK